MAESRVHTTNRGTCKVCQRSISSSRMGAHMQTHIPKDGRRTQYVIRIDDEGLFWMYLQVSGRHTLKKIDEFLRDEWLECCGHMSRFEIDDIPYESHPPVGWTRSKSMNHKVLSVLKEKMTVSYEYDFGTTTALRLTVLAGPVPPVVPPRGIKPLAVHDKIRYLCDVCGKDATKVCTYCTIYTDGSILCKDCIPKHQCVMDEGEDCLMDLVQSPRVGMCGFDREPLTLHN